MDEPVLAYESLAVTPGVTGRCLFGVVVRTFGLILILWGLYTLLYLFGYWLADAPLGGQSLGSVLVFGVFLVAAGCALLRGRWLVRLAYGPTDRRD